ncbi:hypothetical protein HKBW3S03_01206 [Candidatus Hakubella thermalkaliphila]|uniref:Integrase catalytic domain-containing protein n=3 Tax=Candidatus Hakubella thermalkaliphila TaxID=2754717 RepID=A0A6V8NK09_9ACTN|nr:IS21 family transposase [Candidatus Hakubella thermalkaliphila]GFP19701.1 hypothetical protein HKBW3S03_01206 [Candidatus Hakubella thermalkaliphila]
MAKKRVTMNKVREIIRLHEEMGLSYRKIARALRISHPIVSQDIAEVKAAGLGYADIKTLSDTKLLELLEKRRNETERYKKLSERFPYLAQELKKTGVNRLLLWEEYRKECSNGYSYSQFCYHLQVWLNAADVTMHLNHKAGDKAFVDFAGKKLSLVDLKTGEVRPVETFVAILGASQLTYVEAVESQKKENWIKANENALWYFGGVPAALVPDCLKSGVTKGDKYEPDINPEYSDFAQHYHTVILPARPHSAKDKALVENAVNLVYIRIYAPLRDRIFYSLEDLNQAIWELLEGHNKMNFQRLGKSRRQLFEEIEKPALKPLPLERYELRTFLNLKVQFNYHIELREDRHYYSVPWEYKGKRVQVLYTDRVVEIYHDHLRIAFHKRDRTPHKYTTLREHMPPHHRFYDEWSP